MVNIIDNSLLKSIRELLINSRQELVQAVNHTIVASYWEVGRLIVESEQNGNSRAVYGKKTLEQLSIQLTEEFGRGFNVANLRRMRTFYLLYPIRSTVRIELSWSHYRTLLRVSDDDARAWYTEECIRENWSSRALDRQVSTQNYERILSSSDASPVREEARKLTEPLADSPRDIIRDPYVLEFLNLPYESVVESDIEQALVENLQKFILELGSGFAFVERQQRISAENQDFYIDLVFYNYKLKRFLLIDLKVGKLTHQDIGQMDMYVRMYDDLKIQTDDNPTIGLILCSQTSEAVAKYSVLSDSEQLFASKYLPSIDTLKRELERERKLIAEKLENKRDSNDD